jgi:4-amino-4-deoxy-L-arabinose transferase-like glycosyltransferase
VPGLIGHDPWKPFEAQAIDIVMNFTQGKNWVLPMLVNEPYLDRGPLFFWMAALLDKFLPFLPLHDVVRMLSGCLTALGMWGVGLTGRELYGRRFGRYAVLALIGCIGLVFWGHHAAPQIMSLPAFAWMLYALVLSHRRPLPAGLILGVSLLMVFLGGMPQEIILSVVLIAVTLICHSNRAVTVAVVLVSALAIAVPIGLLWPLALKQTYPELYAEWLTLLFSRGGLVQPSLFRSLSYHLTVSLWFCWPAWPLSVASLWAHRKELKTVKWRLPLIWLLVFFVWMVLFSPELTDYVVLPVLIPLALMTAGGVNAIRRAVSAALNWFGLMTFGLGALCLWLAWGTVYFSFPAFLLERAKKFNPTFAEPFSLWTLLFALVITFIWGWIISRKNAMAKQALINWTCGITLVWALAMALLQNWIDDSKSYRSVAVSLKHNLPEGCVVSQGLTDPAAASLHYFIGLSTQELEQGGGLECKLLLIQTTGAYLTPPKAVLLWSASRPGESKERFYLYRIRQS